MSIRVENKVIADMVAQHALWIAASDQARGKQAVFTGMNVSGHDFTSDDLSRADFTGANCSACTFTSATCTDANFTGANLVHANFTSADLTRANMTGADTTNAVFTSATTTNIVGFDTTVVVGNGATSITLGAPVVQGATTGITAFATGGQASATALTTDINFVTTVATTDDSVKLPTAALGKRVVVQNLGANSLGIFPATGGAIDALGDNAKYDLAAGAWREFIGQSATQWRSKA
jgi:hypothetical protein